MHFNLRVIITHIILVCNLVDYYYYNYYGVTLCYMQPLQIAEIIIIIIIVQF